MDKKPISRLARVKGQIQSLAAGKVPAEEMVDQPVHAFLHFWALALRSFVQNRCPVRATALAYTTLLALVPLLAVSLGVSSSLLKSEPEETKRLIEELIDYVAPQLEQLPGTEQEKIDARQRMVEQIQSFIANIHSGALGLTGIVALLVVALGLLSTIEITFNDIWGVSRGRTWFSRVICYWTAITLGPLVVLLAMGLAVSSQFLPGPEESEPDRPQTALNQAEGVSGPSIAEKEPVVTVRTTGRNPVRSILEGPVGRVLFGVLPFVILSGSFALFYKLMPNTRVKWRAAMIGGVVGATLWLLNSKFNVAFASRVVAASTIYGPLGVVPVFLIGLYFSWLIVLFGAQVSYAFQNRRAYLMEKLAEGTNQRGREFIAIRLMLAVGRRFQKGDSPPSLVRLATELGVSSKLLCQVIAPLLQCNILMEVNSPETAYAPARPLDQISTDNILLALRSGQGLEPSTPPGPDRDVARAVCDKIEQAERDAAGPMTLQRLLDRS
jgi:membrane protein